MLTLLDGALAHRNYTFQMVQKRAMSGVGIQLTALIAQVSRLPYFTWTLHLAIYLLL